MTLIIRTLWVVLLIANSTLLMAQYGVITPNELEKVHIHKIDSLDEHKQALTLFKKQYIYATAVRAFDTTKNYVLRFSDTVKYDLSKRRFVHGEFIAQDTLYQMETNRNLYYRSRTFKHEPTTYTAKHILELYSIQNKWLVPIIPDSLSGLKQDSKTYYDYCLPYLYKNQILILKQHHGYHGYNHVGLINFSNEINHYFDVIE
ncbi:MAG: hypothetical protein ACI8SE_001943 [Bacteroidia bacterium]|jgi:hypothetical protein